MARRDRDATIGLQRLHGDLHAWRWTDAEIDDFATGGQESGENGGTDHWSRRARVATNQDPAAVEIGTKRLGKLNHEFGREGLTHNAANAGDADLQGFHRSGNGTNGLANYAVRLNET